MRHLLSTLTMAFALALLTVTALGQGDALPRNDDFRFGGPALLGGTVVEPCTADTNADDVVDVLDLINVILQWGPCPGCSTDIDENGVVDVLDLIEVIVQWGPCE